MKVRKAIIPVAGIGTRFLPVSKALPKEMINLVDKPVIQYIVEEAVAAGIEDIIFITSQNKRAIEDHFDRNLELESRLEAKGKDKELKLMQDINKLARFASVRQHDPLGDGHALLSALPFVEDGEPILVMFGDDVFDSAVPVTRQLIDIYEKYHDSVAALYDVGHDNVAGYGIAGGQMIEEKVMAISKFIEKPAVAEAPSSFAGVGRYVVTPEILNILKTLKPGKDGELRLADAFTSALAQGHTIHGRIIDGLRFDCGNKQQALLAAVHFGLKHPEVNKDGELAQQLQRLIAEATKKN